MTGSYNSHISSHISHIRVIHLSFILITYVDLRPVGYIWTVPYSQAKLYFCEQQKLGLNSSCIRMPSSLLEENAWPLLGRSPGYLVSWYVTLVQGQLEYKAAAGLGAQRLSLSRDWSRQCLRTSWIASEPAQKLFQMVNRLDDSTFGLKLSPGVTLNCTA